MEDSIFTKIVKGEIPCYKIYEDELTLAFLDIHPVQSGHVLVIPKEQIQFVWDLPDELYLALMKTTKKIALHMREILPQQYISERITGVDVPHAHVQLIPFDDALSELSVSPDMNAEPNHLALEKMAQMLRFN